MPLPAPDRPRRRDRRGRAATALLLLLGVLTACSSSGTAARGPSAPGLSSTGTPGVSAPSAGPATTGPAAGPTSGPGSPPGPPSAAATAPRPAATTAGAVPSPVAPPTTRPAARPVTAAGTTTETVASAGLRRSYVLYRPRTAPASGAPVVIVLHGAGASPAKIRSLTRFDRVGDERGWLVAYPESQPSPTHWQEGCCDTFDRGSEDVAFVSDLVDDLVAQGADPRRVYLVGFSSGGLLAYRSACLLSGRLTAIGSVGGTQRMPTSGCHPSRPVSVIEVHGTEDYYDGTCGNRTQTNKGCSPGSGNYSPTVQDLNAEWRGHDGCPAPSSRTVGRVTTLRAGPCSGGTGVTLVSVAGGKHCWQGGNGAPSACQVLDATATIAAFLAGKQS